MFGKTHENTRHHVDMRLTTDAKQTKRLIAKQNFKSFKIINKDLTLVTLSKTKVETNKPIAVGSAILDISKKIVYNFHYNYILPKFGPNRSVNSTSSMRASSDVPAGNVKASGSRVKLLFSDTDSVCYYFEGVDDIFSEMAEDSEKYFDLSDFPKDHKC